MLNKDYDETLRKTEEYLKTHGIDFEFIVLFNYGVIKFASNAITLLLFTVMLLGLKYKYNDAKLRNIVCNVLPFVYVGVQAVMVVIKMIDIIYE